MSFATGLHHIDPHLLRESADNPREILDERFEDLRYSLRSDPRMLNARPLICDLDGNVVAGNMRRRAIVAELAEGSTEELFHATPVWFEDFSGPEGAQRRREWMLRDNQEYGDWVPDQLAELLAAHAESDGDMRLLGFGDHELKSLLELAASNGGGTPDLGDPDDVPPAPAEPRSRLGDLWRLGDHVLLCGSSTNFEDVTRLQAAAGVSEVDLLITDPPYGVAYQTKLSTKEAVARHRRTDGKEVENDALSEEDTRDLFAQALELSGLKEGGSFYATVPAGPMMRWFIDAVDRGFPSGSMPPALRQILTWVKDVFVMGRTDYHYRHEPILYGWRPGAAHYFLDDRTQDSVWEIPRPKRSEEHPTMKPTDLFRRMIVNSSLPGQAVYDPFCGSGTTLICAEAEGRQGLAIELSPVYVDVIVQRWEDYTGRKGELERDGRVISSEEWIATGIAGTLAP